MRIALSLVLLAAPLASQSNAILGADVTAYDVGSMSTYGRQGAAYPNGEVGVAIGHSFCNAGTVNIAWEDDAGGGQMTDTYPKIAFLLAKQVNGRMIQISGRSFLKHSGTPFNFSSGPCAPCTSGSGPWMRVGCSDTYGPGFNSSQYRLGPPEEINPWLGSWDHVGSYFDRGDPPVAGSAASDNLKSLDGTMVSAFGPVKNRVIVRENELGGGNNLFAQVQVVIKGEPVGNRDNNIRNKDASMTYSGGSWSSSTSGTSRNGSVLTMWNGATLDMAGNGADDGRFLVACKVTGPVNEVWHYEYAVHNIDNHRGGATFRIPVDPAIDITNVGVHDVDADPSNDWTWSRNGSELSFLAGAENANDWNTIFNFWFDCSVGPQDGTVEIDQARPGTGAGSVTVGAQIPESAPDAEWSYVGQSCGLSILTTAAPVLGTTFTVVTAGIPSGSVFATLMFSFGQAQNPIDLTLIGMPGCEFYGAGPNLTINYPAPMSIEQTNVTIPLGTSLNGHRLIAQSFAYNAGLPGLGVIASDGLRMIIGP
ncbi:MAG: hypothetical protein KDB80_12875 [Planctomycetes bacterium]|nr:hypothetical protein [Planctomycetota bacterium]